jgi:geranylgeranyl transferase type-2 subunit beta
MNGINNGYLARLMVGLTVGASQLNEATRQRHLSYVLCRQQPDGGWGGREGGSDLYYTSFALRSLAILGQLQGDLAERCSQFLRSRLGANESIVDLLSLVYSAKLIQAACDLDPLAGYDQPWQARLAALLDSLRRDDGGYSKTIEGKASSTYQTFLALICLELIDMPIPNPDSTAEFLLKQRQGDGGFLEIRVAKRSGANPTAAAIGGLSVLDRIEDSIANSAADFLLELQSEEGGFQANSRIPMADLLSTFTALVTLSDLGEIESANVAAIGRYVQSMEIATGGFHGFEFDQDDDVEYTFYGLGSLALLQLVQPGWFTGSA